MASISRATLRASIPLPSDHHKHALISAPKTVIQRRSSGTCLTVVRVLDGGDSYLVMWRKAVDREKKETEFQKLAQNLAKIDDSSGEGNGENKEVLEKKTEEFQKILETSQEERDRIQRMQVIDRAAAAIAAARSIIKRQDSSPAKEDPDNRNGKTIRVQEEGKQNGSIFITGSGNSGNGTPGPDFWSWIPPQSTDQISDEMDGVQTARQTSEYPILSNPVLEKDRSVGFLSIPFESKGYETNHNLPPFQSLLEVDKTKASELAVEKTEKEEHELEVEFSAHAAEAAEALHEAKELSSQGIKPDGTRWWRETGIEQRPDGVICRWTMIRGVNADQTVEWQEKYWEASDEFDYKELGSEKSGRDAFGNVWIENWRESVLQDGGLVHLEKTADKWGKNAKGEEWQEKWWEHYDASGKSEKWADKWCSIDPNTPLEAGHAHVWHERWGEKYDGYGGSVKYTDKWAERCKGDGWAKWGDKWDEHFDPNGHGVKQGETWWQGKHGDRWNRTWGERHNGSGWVHKYGKSSSGEHWDTHVAQETWYARFPHYGFYHCFDNSVQLREVKKPSEMSKQQTI